MTDEKQKKTTDQYRKNWDEIFKKPKQKEDKDVQPRKTN